MTNQLTNRTQESEFNYAENNFDLIRLVAAGEVAVRHSIIHIAPGCLPKWLESIFALIPGVPIFFFLSGYLISRAWERSASPRDYFRNRALRLFPALWMCTALSVTAVFTLGYMSTANWSALKLAMWVVCQGTVFQFWNPDFFRGFGVGVVNGSLWTVSVEIQFYFVIAILYTIFRSLPSRNLTWALIAIAVSTASLNWMSPEIVHLLTTWSGSELAGKIYEVSFLPWIFMFLLGAIAQRACTFLIPILLDKSRECIIMYVVACLVDFHIWGLPLGNNIPAYLVPLMGAATLVCGYSHPKVANRILRRNDISYGLYIYHMPLVNLALWLGYEGYVGAVFVVLGASALIAGASWRFVERPLLSRKRSTVRGVSTVGTPAPAGTFRQH